MSFSHSPFCIKGSNICLKGVARGSSEDCVKRSKKKICVVVRPDDVWELWDGEGRGGAAVLPGVQGQRTSLQYRVSC